MNENVVTFRGVTKTYARHGVAVAGLNLDVRTGEFLSLLGPSGSGKTTTLMMLAGFEDPSEGDILLHGKSINSILPQHRNFGVVFQNYALFPRMTVADNVGFALSVRGKPREEIGRKVAEALRMVRLNGLEDRLPQQLSGGQQQRVALARAIVFGPELILMDEPLGALDRQLRQEMQSEIKRLHRELGVTIIYVTHDQEEALTMSDRIAIFNRGRALQLGTPKDIYNSPESVFVAQFMGENNILPGTVTAVEGRNFAVRLASGLEILASGKPGVQLGTANVSLRPEKIHVGPPQANQMNRAVGKVTAVVFVGQSTLVTVDLTEKLSLKVAVPADANGVAIGKDVELHWKAADTIVLSGE